MCGEGVCYQRRFKLHNVGGGRVLLTSFFNFIMCGEGVCYQRRFKLYNVGGGRVLSTSFQTS